MPSFEWIVLTSLCAALAGLVFYTANNIPPASLDHSTVFEHLNTPAHADFDAKRVKAETHYQTQELSQ